MLDGKDYKLPCGNNMLIMNKYIIFYLSTLCIILTSGCIYTKNINKLWVLGDVDKKLEGTWVLSENDCGIKYKFIISEENMLCIVFNEHEINGVLYKTNTVPLQCRSVVDTNTGISFLLVPDSYNSYLSCISGEYIEESDNLGFVIPYSIKNNKLIIFSGNNNLLKEKIKSQVISGDFLVSGGNPTSRIHSYPLLDDPSISMLNVIAQEIINTNKSLVILTPVSIIDK